MSNSIPLERFLEFMQSNNTISAEDAYDKVGWFRRACDIRAESVRKLPFDVLRGDEIILDEDAVNDLAGRPGQIDVFALMDDIVLDLDLYGAFYAVFETNTYNRNGAWRRLHPSTIEPVYDADSGLSGFKRVLRGRTISYGVDELLYVWMPNRRREIGPGRGVAYSALLSVTGLYHTQRFQGAFFENGALNPTIISVEGYDSFRESEQTRIRQVFNNLMSGLKNAFSIIPVGGNVSATNLMQPLRDLGMHELTQAQREDIATSMGVPHSLLMSNAANYATASADALGFYDHTIVPLATLIQHQLNKRLFGPTGHHLMFRPDRLEIYQQLEAQKSDRLVSLLTANVMDRNEVRDQLGLEPQNTVSPAVTPAAQPDALQAAIMRLQDDTSQAARELKQWRSYAMKRYRERTPDKARHFESRHIPAPLAASLNRQLAAATGPDGVNSAFDAAEKWVSVPHARY